MSFDPSQYGYHLAFGTSSRSSSSRFAPSAPEIMLTPVMFPPGRLKLLTNPSLTGSSAAEETIGMLAVAALAARAALLPPLTITATCSWASLYRLRQRHLRHHPSQAAQDRSARARQRPPHQNRHGIGLSGRARLGTRRNPARNRRHSPRLPGMTRAAPARSLRGTTHRPTETQKIADIDSAFGATNIRGAGPAADKIGLPPSVV